ncbi:hypothetical protein [Pseudofrankia asymbiotica]|uniref:Uncharacterized protein n=1 Tax=Pseudofrankia asymbiotica TaxID=1834516 RepID=A0A1V2I7F2_9ACTN|nr:hypothetical protein [Pseudofrankia asymbiotica]ONH27974.1 hypothetical protein BL253_20400 [Pseudofrankia asymbiotica]
MRAADAPVNFSHLLRLVEADHSVRVLLTVYAKCIVGEEKRALRLIDASFAAEQDDVHPPDAPEATLSDDPQGHDRVHAESTDTRPQPPSAGHDRTPSVTETAPSAELPDGDFGL